MSEPDKPEFGTEAELVARLGANERVTLDMRLGPGEGRVFKTALDTFIAAYLEANPEVTLLHSVTFYWPVQGKRDATDDDATSTPT